MAHQVETMFSGSMVTPWHKLGKIVDGTPTTADAIKLAGLDWRVRLEELQLAAAEWRTPQAVPARAAVRDSDGRILGVVGAGYTVLQNSEAFAVADGLAERGARWETAGSLSDGSRVWMLCRMRPSDGGEEICRGDVVHPYLLITTSHDGSAAVRVQLTSVRVVCANTLRMSLQNGRGDGISIRHTSGVVDRTAEAARIVTRAEDIRREWATAARAMAERRIDAAQARALAFSALEIDPTAQDGRKAAKRREMETRLRAEINRPGTVWGAVQAVTEFTSHSARAGHSRGMDRLLSTVDGTGDRANQRAWSSALAMI